MGLSPPLICFQSSLFGKLVFNPWYLFFFMRHVSSLIFSLALLLCAPLFSQGFNDADFIAGASGNTQMRTGAQMNSSAANFVSVGRYWNGTQYKGLIQSYLVSTGLFDPNFGIQQGSASGRITFDFAGSGYDNLCNAVVYTYDGFIAACRSLTSTVYYDTYLVKFDNYGNLNTSFGNGGIIATGIGGNSTNGHAYVRGIVYNPNTSASDNGVVTIVGSVGRTSPTYHPFIASFDQQTGAQVGTTVILSSTFGTSVNLVYDGSTYYYMASTDTSGNRHFYVDQFDNNLNRSSAPWGSAVNIASAYSAAGQTYDAVPSGLAIVGSHIVLAGGERNTTSGNTPWRCTLAAVSTSNGNLDTGFGNVYVSGGVNSQGVTIFSPNTSYDCILNSLQTPPTGTNLFIAGTAYNGTNYDHLAAGFDNTGNYLTGFGSSGMQTQYIGPGDDILNAALYLAGGTTYFYGIGRTQNAALHDAATVTRIATASGAFSTLTTTVTSISPATGPSGTVVTITGTNFSGTPTVNFFKSPATTIACTGVTLINDNTLTCTAGTLGAAAIYDIQVTSASVMGTLSSGFTQAAAICDSGDYNTTCTLTTNHVIASGAVITVGGNLTINTGGGLQGSATNTQTLHVAGTLTISSGTQIAGNFTITAATLTNSGTITARNYGYAATAGTAPGATASNSGNNGGGGGGHGGAGGTGNGGFAGGATYGNPTQPTTFGSGGGSRTGSGSGGLGGGALKIVVSGTLTNTGSIVADGNNGGTDGGGGAGGSLWIIANTLAGSGSYTANGASSNAYGGSGAGGRIAIYANSGKPTSVALAAGAVASYAQGVSGTGSYYQSIVNPCDSGTIDTGCTLSSTSYVGDGQTFNGASTLSLTSTLSNPGGHAFSVTMGGAITLTSGTLTGNVTVTAPGFTVDSGSLVSANSLGYVNDQGSAPGSDGASTTGAGGGGHGGAGGTGSAGATAGGTYGSQSSPITYGSGRRRRQCRGRSRRGWRGSSKARYFRDADQFRNYLREWRHGFGKLWRGRCRWLSLDYRWDACRNWRV